MRKKTPIGARLITTWVINLAPIGVFFLIGGQVLGMGDFGKVLMQLGWYFTTVILGLFIHGLIVLPILYSVVTRTLPFKFIWNMANAFTTAFGTGSSSATLPVTIILAVDWLLDRFRTTINVLGDSLGAGIVYHLSKDELDDFGKPPTKHADGGFESVPMTDAEENGHPGK